MAYTPLALIESCRWRDSCVFSPVRKANIITRCLVMVYNLDGLYVNSILVAVRIHTTVTLPNSSFPPVYLHIFPLGIPSHFLVL